MTFLAELSYTDLVRLRRIVRATKMRVYPKELCTDYEADRIIETLGPKMAEDMIRRHLQHAKMGRPSAIG